MQFWTLEEFQFLSTPSARRATWPRHTNGGRWVFLSTPSARRATTFSSWSMMETCNFYPRPPR